MRTALAAVIVSAAVLASVYGFFFYRDNFSTHYPIKVLSAEAFRSAEIPYWNFADAGGQPLAGNPNTLTFYPDNILYLILPAHVAFNLHFFLHLALAFFAMRALTKSDFAASVYVLSGIVVSATAFYNLIVAVAVIPLAFLAAERRRPALLGLSFGLLALAGEPVMIVGATIAVGILAIDRMRIRDFALAIVISLVIAAPQLVAYSEIASEVERSVAMSSRTVLNASLHPVRVVEVFAGPIIGVLNDAGGPFRARLFSTIFLGLIAVPALFRRSRYVAIAAVMLFFALGRYNPIIAAIVDHVSAVRIVRFPEKFALPMIVALVVLVAMYFRETPWKRAWLLITILPLVLTAWRALPIDRFEPYRVTKGAPRRVYVASVINATEMPARTEYRLRAQADEPLFGATGGLRYVINPSPEGMHALRSRMVLERFQRGRQRYAAIAANLPAAFFPSRSVAGRDIYEEASLTEAFANNETVITSRSVAVGPARVLRYSEHGQRITIDVDAPRPALLFVNQTYFTAWDVRAAGRPLDTVALDVDRLGIIVPAGTTRIDLRFGRRHAAGAIAWIVSSLLLLACLVQSRDRRAGEVKRAGDQDRPLV
ncbi:MAG TPA: hypothetical protein VLV78_00560 [Thermoanaerobaculia bacterium]|nr:hypothetical protein [Thermoanaerobaculia bacterium]